MKRILIVVLLILPTLYTWAQVYDIPEGVVIDHSFAKSGKYIGSPSICILPNGDYVASHDEFGPKSTEFKSAQTLVFKSSDKGETWERIAKIDGQFWSTLFIFKNDLYIMGTNKHHGNIVLRRSTDGGKTWTIPYDSKTGLILEGEYHTAPVPVIEYKGRLWRTAEYATAKTTRWGKRYSAMMLSCSVKDDIMDAENWTHSNTLTSDVEYLDGNFWAWLEGNAVVSPEGKVVNLLRVHLSKDGSEKAAIVKVDKKGKRISFNENDFIDMPGAAKKFTIRYDETIKRYLAIVNNVPEDLVGVKTPDQIRNSIALVSSSDLETWEMHKVILCHSDHLLHAYQYIDWQFDGEDIIFVSRTSAGDEEGGCKRYHDANYLTFHRLTEFRKYINE